MQRAKLSLVNIGFLFIAGFVATMAFDFWGQVVSPGIGWANLSPEGLAQSLLSSLGLPSNAFLGFFVHFYIVGLIAYPLGWFLIFQPIWVKVLGPAHIFVASAIYGFGLWVFAIGGVTTFAGLPPFLNFVGITWVALIGHVLYGIVFVAVLNPILRRHP
ncbi:MULTISPECIES: hypothetical protein [unclassified Ruegeria]|uniref:hypothetical protein n=1 Tax=unclassified Ruegeria TaxID=2625375 RepID=UPI001492727B|nr:MULTISPECIES: hypothetical protein [unclassified Ruegeria]NOC47159.1 hypothetical protein [Ruegeria sp. HKCCD7559]NOD86017.1 hypothetical protein [Ruegeria sp. HKCCD6119]